MKMKNLAKAVKMCAHYPEFVRELVGYACTHEQIDHLWFKINLTASEQEVSNYNYLPFSAV